MEEHIVLVNEYALLLTQKHGLEPLIDGIISELVQKYPNPTYIGNWVKKLFLSAIIYHDYGKVNPNFQSEKMKEDSFLPYDKSIKIDTQHSKLSAYIYVNDFVQTIQADDKLSEDDKYFLFLLCSLFSVPILKHHAPFIDHYIDFKEDELKSINRFLKEFDIEQSWDDVFTKEGAKSLVEDLMPDVQNPILIIILLKLNFSLLTSSDYYATNQYMNGFAVNDFGLIDADFKEKLYQNYWNYAYNQDTRNKWEILRGTDFEKLQERNNVNLNQLRAKLLIETVESIKENPNKNLYYLEAPTGAGKTNLSLALALELLKSEQSLNKIFYVFPFTTLIVQTFEAIKNTLGITNEHIIQLHSKSGFHSLEEDDAKYGNEKLNYLDNLFLNYPITLLTHIKFFNILKGNDKETNYIYHRLANSVVIIDELQSYNPKHWDKIAWMLSEYGRVFNIKFVLMSATLPKINEADKTITVPFERLIKDKNNPNFGQRIEFDFTLLDWEKPQNTEGGQIYLDRLASFVKKESDAYALNRKDKDCGKVRTIIEFIKKKSANEFYQVAINVFKDYKIYVLSGEILDPRRSHIIKAIKAQKDEKVLLITTQVVEAGVDIDMDLGFKDRSLIDSDEQLAGRVNRNANKTDCKVYIFDYDNEIQIYRSDERRKVTKEKISLDDYKDILVSKDFDKLYQLVFQKIDKKNKNSYEKENIKKYKEVFERVDFQTIKKEFQLIEDDTKSVFVPMPIPIADFDDEMIGVAKMFDISINGFIHGKEVFEKYIAIITNKDQAFHKKMINSKQIYGLISKFIFSVYENAAKELMCYSDGESEKSYTKRFGLIYLLNWKDDKDDQIYSYESGVNQVLLKNDVFL
ncbi:MAG: CRISPR-associated helicase Cas3' [Saprospiraceae bacterium]|nr:CRISPR-associated helicase Cas3' [Saprospiraceae bacterium]